MAEGLNKGQWPKQKIKNWDARINEVSLPVLLNSLAEDPQWAIHQVIITRYDECYNRNRLKDVDDIHRHTFLNSMEAGKVIIILNLQS